MNRRVESLVASRKSPAVLRMKILNVLSKDNASVIFVFEGPEDVGIYEEWIRRVLPEKKYEPVTGAGKEQLIGLFEQVKIDKRFENTYFYVDCDFDELRPSARNLHVLDSYSTENILCGVEVLESILKDEFRLAGSPDDRVQASNVYIKSKREFCDLCYEIDFLVFAARRTRTRLVRKPEKSAEIALVEATFVGKNYSEVSDLVVLESPIDERVLEGLRCDFNALSETLRHRGKYQLDFFYRWLVCAFADIKSPTPLIFSKNVKGIKGDVSGLAMRRLASASKVPVGLREFLNRV